MKPTLTFLFALATLTCLAQPSSDKDILIKTAVLAAPQELREQATVMSVSAEGNAQIIRKGSNKLICLADDPAQKGINVSCYHEDLEPFMTRGRELKKQGKSFQEVFDIREQEVKSGKLKMPSQASTLFVYTADDFNAESGEVQNGYLRYVVYIPYATSESTGLPLKPDFAGQPWIMDPGTHRAHIMISPPKK